MAPDRLPPRPPGWAVGWFGADQRAIDTAGEWGCGWCGKAWRRTKSAARATYRWGKRHRGTIATLAASGGCLVPGVGWVGCGAMQGAAYGVRAQQRAAERGWRKSWRANAKDAIWSVASFGVARSGGYARRALGITWRSGRRAFVAVSGALAAPSATYGYGRHRR